MRRMDAPITARTNAAVAVTALRVPNAVINDITLAPVSAGPGRGATAFTTAARGIATEA